jgi:predicted NBD/HSP70 family sugar kinase
MTDLELQLDREATPKLAPVLDPEFRPAALWVRAFLAKARAASPVDVGIAMGRPDGTVFRLDTQILPWSDATAAVNRRHVERLVKYLLWQKGGSRVWISGCPQLAAELARDYAPGGARAFDADLMGNRVFGEEFRVTACKPGELPAPREPTVAIGGHWKGCRIGFDLGGSDRKCAAVIDGQTVFSEEVPWAPVKEQDWHYHWHGIEDSLQRAAAHLPRVDAIGGSSAGIVVNNEVRVASLFRGVPKEDFDQYVRTMFSSFARKWKVPVVVMNDGEVTALAGAMGLNDKPVLGMAFGTSLAGGYCTPQGTLTCWLNELAFAPLDYRLHNAPRDEWSGDYGCGALYLSQQAVGRLAPHAGIAFLDSVGLPERLAETQRRLQEGDRNARQVFETIGRYLGYTIAHHDRFYVLKRILILGRVTSGNAGNILIEEANRVLQAEFPEIAARVTISVPSEKEKRHGQAMVAASLPELQG